MKLTDRIISVLLALTVAGALCASPLRIGNGTEPADLDPHKSVGVPEDNILMNLFEGLTTKHPKTLETLPGVAEKWEVSADGLKYRFVLRENAKWSNGEPVTAGDFVYAWKRLLTPGTGSEYAHYGYLIKNGKKWFESKISGDKFGARAVSPKVLEVELEARTPYFLNLLDAPCLGPLHKTSLEKHGARWTRPENFVGNGPYLISSWEINKEIILKKNPNYWAADTVRLDEARFYPIEDPFTEEKMYRGGQLDITRELPLELRAQWKEKPDYINFPYLGTYFYALNVSKPPLDDGRVREALNLAVDRSRVAKFVLGGGNNPATSLVPPGTGGFRPEALWPLKPNIMKAKALLVEAGYTKIKPLPKIELLYNVGGPHKKIAEALQQMWKKNLGIEVSLVNQEWKVFLDSVKLANFQIARRGWVGNFNDPVAFLEIFTTDSGNNRGKFSSENYDSLVRVATSEGDGKKRAEKFNEAERLLRKEVPLIPLYFYQRHYLKRPGVKGWEANLEDRHPLKHLQLQ